MNQSASSVEAVVRNGDTALRAICRSVIRRVRHEHPGSIGYELFLRLWAAYPFGSTEGTVQQIWLDEVLAAVDMVAMVGEGEAQGSLYDGAVSHWIQ